MNGYIIETRIENPDAPDRPLVRRWIGIFASAKDMIAKTPGSSPSVIDRGPVVLDRAKFMGLRDGEIREFRL